jgi:trans-aconitate methyltransferase
MAMAAALTPPGARRAVDYGAGDGEAAVRLAHRRPELEIVCFEPAPELHAQAAARTGSHPQVRLAAAEAELDSDWADVVLCLECSNTFRRRRPRPPCAPSRVCSALAAC